MNVERAWEIYRKWHPESSELREAPMYEIEEHGRALHIVYAHMDGAIRREKAEMRGNAD